MKTKRKEDICVFLPNFQSLNFYDQLSYKTTKINNASLQSHKINNEKDQKVIKETLLQRDLNFIQNGSALLPISL